MNEAESRTASSSPSAPATPGSPSRVISGRRKHASDTHASDFFDDDSDGKPGISAPTFIEKGSSNELDFTTYASLTIALGNTKARLIDSNTISADSSFSLYGQVVNTSLGIGAGSVYALPIQPSVNVIFKHLAGDVSCSEILEKLP